MPIKLILRLVMALIFATFTVIFSTLLPPIPGTDPLLVKILFTLILAMVGFLIFPDVAKSLKILYFSFISFIITRLSSEVSNQIFRIVKGTHFPSPIFPTPQIGSLSISKPLILDTSAIIDGRILDIAKAGFISGLILIPKFVLLELQQVSDSSDALKRARGRRGFEVVEELKKIKSLRVDIWEKEQGGKNADDKLLNLAKSLHGKIITTDFNLNKLASISNVSVLNVNDLANALKSISLPGEVLKIKIVHIGKEQDQGVGYLSDGTMIVVEDAGDKMGETLKVEVTKSIQIPQGRMIFAKQV